MTLGAHYLSEFIALLSGALCFAGGVAQGEDDGSLVVGRHVLDDLLGEGACDGGHT